MTSTAKQVKKLKALQAALEHIDPEDAAVLIADESGHPYEWRDILHNPAVRRRYVKALLRTTDLHSDLYRRIQRANQALASVKETP